MQWAQLNPSLGLLPRPTCPPTHQPHDLQVRDFLQRVRSRRFPPIEGDVRMALAHCGSLLLDPAALQEVRVCVCVWWGGRRAPPGCG